MLTDPATADRAEQAAAMRRLWSAVALLAIADADADPLGRAGAYLRSADFCAVATLAGLDGDAARDRLSRRRAAGGGGG